MTEGEFEEIVNSSWNETFRFCCRRVSCFDDAEDITLEVFIRLWKHKDNVDPGKVDRWIKRVAGNCVTDYYRRSGTTDKPLFDSLDMVAPIDIQEEYCVQEDVEKAIGLMDKSLTDQQELILHLYYGCGKKGGTIAKEIGLTPGGVQSCRLRALENLRVCFEGSNLL